MENWIKKENEKTKSPDTKPNEGDKDLSYYPELEGVDLSNYPLPDDAFPDDDVDVEGIAEPVTMQATPPSRPEKRRIVKAPQIFEAEEPSAGEGEISIKAQPSKNQRECTLFVSRPVLEGHSLWYADAASAPGSPLAERLFSGLEGLETLLIHHYTVTLTLPYPLSFGEWQGLAEGAGSIIRDHLEQEMPVAPPGFLKGLPGEEEIRGKLQGVIDTEINPGIASHGGVITLNKVEGNSVYITMGGGCQGCSAASLTLREGIFNAFRTAVPQVGAILDETNHSAGENPYYTEPIPGAE